MSGKPVLRADARAYATEVMRILSDGTIRIGIWSETERDHILRTITEHHCDPNPRLELIVSDPGMANFRLKPDPGNPKRGRVADYRMSSIGLPERPDVAAVNGKLKGNG